MDRLRDARAELLLEIAAAQADLGGLVATVRALELAHEPFAECERGTLLAALEVKDRE